VERGARQRTSRTIIHLEDGKLVRDFIFIDDVADAICWVVTCPSSSPIPYDVRSGKGTTIHERACMIAAYYDAPQPHINGAFRNYDVRHATCDIARTTREMGWLPKCDLVRGLELLFELIDGG